MPAPNNLPARRVHLIGREKEVSAIHSFLTREDRHEGRLLTLSGPAGIGKTRLALQVAADLLDANIPDFQDGIFFVSLDPIREPGLLARAIAQALGVHEVSDRPLSDTLREYLHDKRMLLVLDNFEQIATAAPLLSELLGAAAHLKLLVTSREVLHIYAEQHFPVPPLDLPPEDLGQERASEAQSPLLPARLSEYAAVRLFVERAASVNPGFTATPENASVLAEICRQLDGLPLAIELAAARTRILPPQAMLDRLQDRLQSHTSTTSGPAQASGRAGRLDLLTGGARNLPLRHQTLRAAIAWSYDLLDEEEQQLFRRLSVFVGGCTLDAIEALCNVGVGNEALTPDSRLPTPTLQMDVLAGVESLLNKSLLGQEETAAGEARFSMLPTIREYAHEQLQESGEAGYMWERYAPYFLQLAEEAEPELVGPRQLEWLDRLEREYDNLRSVLHWAETGNHGQVELGVRMAGALHQFWNQRGYLTEGRARLSALVLRADAVQTGALTLSDGLRMKDDNSQSSPNATTPTPAYAKAVTLGGALAWRQSDVSAARQLYEQGLTISQQIGLKPMIAKALAGLGNVNRVAGEFESARTLFEQALTINRELGDKWSTAVVLGNLGLLFGMTDDVATATMAFRYFEESLAIFREIGDKANIGNTFGYMGRIARPLGDHAKTRLFLQEALTILRELNDKVGMAASLFNLAEVVLVQGDYAQADALFTEGLTLSTQLGDRWNVASLLEGRGYVAKRQGENGRAFEFFTESLHIRREFGHRRSKVICLAGMAGVVAALGYVEDAAQLFGAIEADFESIGRLPGGIEMIEYSASRAAVRSQLGEAIFAEVTAEGRTMSIADATELALHPRTMLGDSVSAEAAKQMPEPQPVAPAPSGENHPDKVTAREAEVLRLLAAGKSNPRIAEELYLSVKTVETHLRSVYKKLGVSSRSEAALYALTHGLA